MTNDKHREFAELICDLKGFVVLSGYPSAIYEELFEQKGWSRVDRQARVLGGAIDVRIAVAQPARRVSKIFN